MSLDILTVCGGKTLSFISAAAAASGDEVEEQKKHLLTMSLATRRREKEIAEGSLVAAGEIIISSVTPSTGPPCIATFFVDRYLIYILRSAVSLHDQNARRFSN